MILWLTNVFLASLPELINLYAETMRTKVKAAAIRERDNVVLRLISVPNLKPTSTATHAPLIFAGCNSRKLGRPILPYYIEAKMNLSLSAMIRKVLELLCPRTRDATGDDRCNGLKRLTTHQCRNDANARKE
jgi:hypothetical protein